MKKALLFSVLSLSINMLAQPTIQNGSNVPSPGYSAPVSMATTTNFGSAGANQTWNFSSLSFSGIGTATIITPSSSTMSSSFPTANFANSFAGTSSFFNIGATKMEVQAYSITSPGTGNDFSPNPRTVLQFPFNFNDVATDSWQKVGGSVNTITLTYDGYGTLIMPSMTYSNVVRVKEAYGNGDDYQWYSLNPLLSVLVYDHNNNTMYFTGATPTGISEKNNAASEINVFPNPVTEKLYIHLSQFNPSEKNTVLVLNALGQPVMESVMNSKDISLDLSSVNPGAYFYQVYTNGNVVKTAKLIRN